MKIDHGPNEDVEQYLLYNINRRSFIVLDAASQQLRHLRPADFRYGNLAELIYLERSRKTESLRLRHKTNGYIVALRENLVKFGPDTDSSNIDLNIISAGANEIAISSNGFHVCANENGAITISSAWILGWEKFALVTRRAAYDLAERRLLDPFPPRKNRRMIRTASQERYGDRSFILSDVRVTATDWSLLTRKGRLLTPDADHLQRGHSRDVLLHQRPVHPQIHSQIHSKLHKACLIGGYYNYYHHLADYMINFFGVRNWIDQDMPLLSIRMENSFQREIAVAFGIDRQLIEMDHLICRKIDNLLVPEKAIVKNGIVRNLDTVQKCARYLRDKFTISNARSKRIFISRGVARSRRAVNENRAISAAADYGFEKVNLEEMPFIEQVNLFSNAEAVIGIHGAGFTNIMFAPKDCLVIEIMPSGDGRPAYFSNLATGLGHRFERIFAKGGFGSTNLEIDVEALQRILRQHLG